MPRSTIIFILVLTILASLLGYNYFARPFSASNQAISTASEQPTEPIETETEKTAEPETDFKLADELSPDQQLAQLIAVPYSLADAESTSSAVLDFIKQNQPGVVTLFGSNISTTSAQKTIFSISDGQDLKLRPLIAVDHEGGSVQRLSGTGFTDLPSWKSTCTLDSTKRQTLLTFSAQELSQVGVEVVFAPMLDIASQSAVLKDRVCSADPEVVIQRALEFVDIFNQQKILSVVKHFPGIGSITTDLHHHYDEVTIGEADIVTFKELLEANPFLGVMSAHVGVKDLYEGMPCSLNPDCIGDLSHSFEKALIFTDALDMDSAGYSADSEEPIALAGRAVMAIEAGNDVLVFGPKVSSQELQEILEVLKTVYESDESFQQQVKKSVEKILQYKSLLRQ